MSDRISILQLGLKNWSDTYQIPDDADFYYLDFFEKAPKKPYDIVFVDRKLQRSEIKALKKATKAYTLYVTEGVELDDSMEIFYRSKKGKRLAEKEIQKFLVEEVRNYFPYSYGEKFNLKHMSIAQGFSGKVMWDGNYSVSVEGDYGNHLRQIAFWRNNIPLYKGQAIEFWLEYQKDPEVEIALSFTLFAKGSLSSVLQSWVFSEEELKDLVVIDNQINDGSLFVSVLAKGKGDLKIIALHDRHSRRGHGCFLPGGQRVVTSEREEVFYYFDPGDLKPPLNVYFSGYKTQQGFEGYYLMKKLGCPFLLIAEPRLEGGSFYMGSQEYEKVIPDIISKHLEELGFSNEELIMSGLSMGTFGALYYGCDMKPHGLLLGKPLASIGTVAANEKLHRPGGFPTSLDVLHFLYGNTDKASVERLDKRFWRKFDRTQWGNSKFVISYMIEDDYDSKAYDTILSHLHSAGVQIYGKGIHGRHNDETAKIVGWFKSQYEKILNEDFYRRIEKK